MFAPEKLWILRPPVETSTGFTAGKAIRESDPPEKSAFHSSPMGTTRRRARRAGAGRDRLRVERSHSFGHAGADHRAGRACSLALAGLVVDGFRGRHSRVGTDHLVGHLPPQAFRAVAAAGAVP